VIFGGYFSWAFHAGNWQDRELLLANTRLFYRCVTERPVPAGCDELTFRGHLLAEPVLATGYPPDQVDIVTDHRWIAAHAARLLERPERRFWVVAATYPEAFRERRIMQRFLGALRTAGAQVRLATRSGSSLLYRVTLP
jgi:hypothetical protein